MDHGIENGIEIVHTSCEPEITKLVKLILHQQGCEQHYCAPTPEKILSLVRQYYGADPVRSREIAAYLLRKLTHLNLQETAELTGWTPAEVALNSRVLDQQLTNGDPALKESLKLILLGL